MDTINNAFTNIDNKRGHISNFLLLLFPSATAFASLASAFLDLTESPVRYDIPSEFLPAIMERQWDAASGSLELKVGYSLWPIGSRFGHEECFEQRPYCKP
jgi:hypothetical protein